MNKSQKIHALTLIFNSNFEECFFPIFVFGGANSVEQHHKEGRLTIGEIHNISKISH